MKALGGFSNVVFPEIAHEYTHEMFPEISHMFFGNFSCLNEGLANAVAVTAGFAPPEKLGRIVLRQGDFRDGCIADDEIHDRGDCYLFKIKQVGLLTPQFIFKVFHPLHTYAFDSCTMNEQIGNSLFVLFHESANGADVRPALDAMKLPHAASYDAAKVALGL